MKKIYKIIYLGIVCCLMWITITSTIQRFKCDKLTETQLLKLIP